MCFRKRVLGLVKETPTIAADDCVIDLADFEAFLDKLATERNKDLNLIQAQLEVFCAKCGSKYTQEALSHLYMMGPKSSYRRRMGDAVVLTSRTKQGDALRSGRCPACGCNQMRIKVPPATVSSRPR